MSDPDLLICAAALDNRESEAQLDALRRLSVVNSSKFLVVTGKFETQKDARSFNVEAQYPAETALLQTVARWADAPSWPDPHFRDGYDLFCLRRVLEGQGDFGLALLWRDGMDFAEHWPKLREDLGDSLFLTFGVAQTASGSAGPNLLVNLERSGAGSFLSRAVNFFITGRSFAIEPYSLARCLELAAETVALEERLKAAHVAATVIAEENRALSEYPLAEVPLAGAG